MLKKCNILDRAWSLISCRELKNDESQIISLFLQKKKKWIDG